MIDDRVHLTQQEWFDLIENKLAGHSDEGQILHCLARIPNLMHLARNAMHEDRPCSTDLAQKIQDLNRTLMGCVTSTRAHLDENDLSSLAQEVRPPKRANIEHFIASRRYGFALMAGMLANCLARNVTPGEQVDDALARFMALEVIKLAMIFKQYQPVGSMSIVLSLSLAYIATSDEQIRHRCKEIALEYRSAIDGASDDAVSAELHWLEQRSVFGRATATATTVSRV